MLKAADFCECLLSEGKPYNCGRAIELEIRVPCPCNIVSSTREWPWKRLDILCEELIKLTVW